jgi:phosphoketolase
MNERTAMVNFSPNRGSGMTLEAFARAHKLPLRWLELREACEEIVRHADFWYRPDLRQQAGDLAVEASNILQSALKQEACGNPHGADALSSTRLK